MDNPDAAYAKLREMGKGLFGPDGAKLGDILNSFGLGTTTQGGSNGNSAGNTLPQIQLPGPDSPIGQALGDMIKQGLSNNPMSSTPGTGIRSRGLPGASTPQGTPNTPAPQASPAPPESPPVAQQDSQPMNDVMRQLFNR
jgi:AsmA protein